jgi:AcrR family transcriptional regulator
MNLFRVCLMTQQREETEAKESPGGTRRDVQKRETRATIRGAARSLFRTLGYEKTTIRAIAARAGVGVGTVHLHFQDKENLLLECVTDDLVENDRRSWESRPKDAPLREQLLHLAREGYRGWVSQPSLSRVALRRMLFTRQPEVDRVRALDRKVLGRTTELLRKAQARGEIRPDADPALATKVIFSFYLISSLDWLGEPDSVGEPDNGSALTHESLTAMVDEADRFLDHLFRGIGI